MEIRKKLAKLAVSVLATVAILGATGAIAAENDDWFYTNEDQAQIFDVNSVIVQGELYLWNRVADLFDILECGIGVGWNIGFDAQITEYAQLAAIKKYGKGVEFPHFIPPFWMIHYFQHKRVFRVHDGQYSALAFGPRRNQNVTEEVRHQVTFTSDPWDLRLELALLAHLYVDVKLDETADFITGFFGYDFKHDDYKLEDSIERRRPADQLGRGVCNILFGALEIPYNILRVTEDEGDFPGITKGVFLGVWRFAIREVVGAVELVSFPFGWDPIILPEYTWFLFSYIHSSFIKTSFIVSRPNFYRNCFL